MAGIDSVYVLEWLNERLNSRALKRTEWPACNGATYVAHDCVEGVCAKEILKVPALVAANQERLLLPVLAWRGDGGEEGFEQVERERWLGARGRRGLSK